ncbi:hypothetical protein AgCh_032983 [Apium graveolens]
MIRLQSVSGRKAMPISSQSILRPLRATPIESAKRGPTACVMTWLDTLVGMPLRLWDVIGVPSELAWGAN